MAHHYRMPGIRNRAQPHVGSPLPSQAGPRRAQRWNLHQGETNGPPELIGQPRRTLSDGVEEPNGRRKISTLIYLLYYQFHYRASDPSNGRGTDIARGLPRVSTHLDILFARPLLTFKTGDTVCGCKTLSKTRQTARPYASVSTMFSFISIIEFIVPHTPSFSIHLLEKGLEGSSYRISFKEKLSGHLKSIERLRSPSRDRNEKLRCSCRSHWPHHKHRT